MTVEENLLMGGFLKDRPAEAKAAAEMVFDNIAVWRTGATSLLVFCQVVNDGS